MTRPRRGPGRPLLRPPRPLVATPRTTQEVSRILAIADCYSTLQATRPYRPTDHATPQGHVRAELNPRHATQQGASQAVGNRKRGGAP